MDHMEMWFQALESDRYEQGQEKLVQFHPEDKERGFYCCLGVGCEIAGLNPDTWEDEHLAPLALVDWLGVRHVRDYPDEEGWDLYIDFPEDLQPADGSREITAASLNDSGCTFKQIAQTIRYFGIKYAK